MFKNMIAHTPFYSQMANDFFGAKIAYSPYSFTPTLGSDRTFISTVRALTYPRMKEEDTLLVTINEYNNRFKSGYTMYDLSRIYEGQEENSILVTNLFGDYASEWFNLASERFEEFLSGRFMKVEKVRDFFRKSFDVVCFVDANTRKTCIFTVCLNHSKLHYLQCGIFAFLPWYFDPKEGVSPIEMQLINSLRDKDSTKYIATLEEIAKAYDFKTEWVKNKLMGIESAFERAEIENLEYNIRDVANRIESYQAQIIRALTQRTECEVKLLGLRQKIAEKEGGDSEILDYFLRNKSLVLCDADNTSFKFGFKGYVIFYDEDQAEKYINNDRSYLYEHSLFTNGVSKSDVKKLLQKVFLEGEIKLRFCAAYQIDLRGGFSPITGYEYGYEFNGYTPNPHIDRFNCMGNYVALVEDYLVRHDYLGAVEQCCASAKSLNFADSTVMMEFMRRICGVSNTHGFDKCFELPDGSIVDAKGAIKYIKSQGKES